MSGFFFPFPTNYRCDSCDFHHYIQLESTSITAIQSWSWTLKKFKTKWTFSVSGTKIRMKHTRAFACDSLVLHFVVSRCKSVWQGRLSRCIYIISHKIQNDDTQIQIRPFDEIVLRWSERRRESETKPNGEKEKPSKAWKRPSFNCSCDPCLSWLKHWMLMLANSFESTAAQTAQNSNSIMSKCYTNWTN